jgi:hypothetical protein
MNELVNLCKISIEGGDCQESFVFLIKSRDGAMKTTDVNKLLESVSNQSAPVNEATDTSWLRDEFKRVIQRVRQESEKRRRKGIGVDDDFDLIDNFLDRVESDLDELTTGIAGRPYGYFERG